jgi:hypothetical protein
VSAQLAENTEFPPPRVHNIQTYNYRYRITLEQLYGALGGSAAVARLLGIGKRSTSAANKWKLGIHPLTREVALKLAERAEYLASRFTELAWELRNVDAVQADYRRQRRIQAARERFRARFGVYPDGPADPVTGIRPRGGP